MDPKLLRVDCVGGICSGGQKIISRDYYSQSNMADDWTKWKVLPEKLKHKKKEIKAPTALFALPNPDKMTHESYKEMDPGENLARFPGPFRCCVIGRVNSGKSLIAKHILMAHQAKRPQFKEVYVCHGMSTTAEYDDIEPTELMTEIPSYSDFEQPPKKLLILDDVDFTRMTGDEKKRISELFRFGSSHMNMSVLLMHQSFFRVPKVAKDCCNVFILFRPVDADELHSMARRVGLKKDQIDYIFNTYLPNFRDSLTINLIPGAPHKFLKNLYEPLDIDFENVV